MTNTKANTKGKIAGSTPENLMISVDAKKKRASFAVDLTGFDLDTLLNLDTDLSGYKRNGTDNEGMKDGEFKTEGNYRVASSMGQITFTHPQYEHIQIRVGMWFNDKTIDTKRDERRKEAERLEVQAKLAAQEAAEKAAQAKLAAKDASKKAGAGKPKAATTAAPADNIEILKNAVAANPAILGQLDTATLNAVMARLAQ